MKAADATPAFDTLATVRRLESAGVNRPQAEAHTDALRDRLARLATKVDLTRLRSDIRGDFARLEARMYAVFVALAAVIVATVKYL